MVKVGIIGSGFAAKFHLEALRRVYDVSLQIIGVHSSTPANLNRFCDKYSLKPYLKVENLIEKCDVLHLCTPPVTHEHLAIKILKKNKHVIIEKPFTGYFGSGESNFSGDTFNREVGLKESIASIEKILQCEMGSKGKIFYAENWIYAPAIQKEREVIEKTKSQILWMQAQQSHSGSHSSAYGKWKLSGGGSLMGKGCHPLAGAIYLKYKEGIRNTGNPIRPKTVTCRTHAITRLTNFEDKGFLRKGYTDVEDHVSVHLTFEDGTIADITSNEIVHGGVKNYIEIHANNHRTICNLTPNNAMQSFNPEGNNFEDVYIVEKTETKEGWSYMSPDEAWFNGYQHEIQAFYNAIKLDEDPESNSQLAADVIITIYAAYLSAERKGLEVEIPIFDFK